VKPPRPEVRPQLTRLDPSGQPGRTTAPQLRPRAAPRQLAVQEHGQLELLAEQIADDERLGAGCSAVGRIEVHDRRHVDRTHPGMDTDMPVDVDPSDHLGGSVQHRPGQASRPAGEGEYAAVMVGVGVDVEQPSVERRADRLDGGRVAALGDVRDRQHGYST